MRSDLRSVSSISGRLPTVSQKNFSRSSFRLCEVLLLRDDAEAGDGIGNRNLPDPGIRDRQEVNVDVIQVRVALGENLAIVAVKPGVNGVLIEYRVFYFQLELVSEEGLAAAAIDNHLAVHAHFLRSDRKEDIRILGAEVNTRNFHAVVHGGAKGLRMLQEHQIELAAIHMVSVVAILHAFLLALFEADIDVVIRS